MYPAHIQTHIHAHMRTRRSRPLCPAGTPSSTNTPWNLQHSQHIYMTLSLKCYKIAAWIATAEMHCLRVCACVWSTTGFSEAIYIVFIVKNILLPAACKMENISVCVCVNGFYIWVKTIVESDCNDLLWSPLCCFGISMVIMEHVDTHTVSQIDVFVRVVQSCAALHADRLH